MLLAPAVGVLLGVLAAAVVAVVRVFTTEQRPTTSVDLLASILGIVVLTLLTRGIHLDGLADTFDGLGVKGEDDGVRDRRLEVMRAPDIGAFGTIALVLTLLVQVAALTECAVSGYGTISLVTAAVTGRLAAMWCCTRSTPSARPDGLGATVAGSVGPLPALALTALVVGGAAALGQVDDDRALAVSLTLAAAVLAGLLVTVVLRARAVSQFGGITGDVLGAAVEIATATVLVVVALGSGAAMPLPH
jgi:adenosylcobinamide-GDP ribazoletransferase